jgi:signal transduction histidine kinase
VTRWARLAWAMTALSLAAATADTMILARASDLLSSLVLAEKGWPLIDAAAVGSSVVGALIVSRQPRNPIGWVLGVVGVTGALALFGESYTVWVVEKDGPGPEALGRVVGWVATLLGSPIILTLLGVMFLVAPDGRLLSPRWRWAVLAGVTGSACFAAALLRVPPTRYDSRGEMPGSSPDSGTAGKVLVIAFLLLVVSTLVAAAASMVIRFRRAEGEARQQLWCFALAALALAAGVVWMLAADGLVKDPSRAGVVALPLSVAYFLLPVLTGTAVLRYRLYNVDLVVNRAVLLSVGTAFAAAGYVVVVVTVSSLVGTRAGNLWLSLLATALVALAFQPLRRRLTRLADRLVYGARAAPYDALSAFSRRLGSSPAPDALLPAVADAAGRAVSARSASARLELAGAAPLVSTWTPDGRTPGQPPIAGAGPEEVEVADPSGRLGTLSVELAPGRRLRRHERVLLEDLAEQAAVAFRNARLEAELATHVSRLDRQTADLEASRRRLFEAEDAERRRVEATISRDVLSTLMTMPTELDRLLAEPDADSASAAIGRLVDQATTALDQLRSLTRGVFPTVLARSGIGPALASYLTQSGDGRTLRVDPSAVDRRFPSRVEAAAYFCCTQAGNPGRVADASVAITVERGNLVLDLLGLSLDAPDRQAMLDRVEALGGSMDVTGGPGRAQVRVRIPEQAVDSPL